MSVSYFAEYSDGSRYQVVFESSERKTFLRTTDGGFMTVPFIVNGAEFLRYDFQYQPQPGLRGCDWATNVQKFHAHLALLKPPVGPAVPTMPVQQPEDFRLHLEAGSDPFRALQATGAKGEAEYRASRQRARQQALQALNEPNAHKIQEARQRAAEILHARKPRGGGVHIIRNGEE